MKNVIANQAKAIIMQDRAAAFVARNGGAFFQIKTTAYDSGTEVQKFVAAEGQDAVEALAEAWAQANDKGVWELFGKELVQGEEEFGRQQVCMSVMPVNAGGFQVFSTAR